jgi:hypothetical protein
MSDNAPINNYLDTELKNPFDPNNYRNVLDFVDPTGFSRNAGYALPKDVADEAMNLLTPPPDASGDPAQTSVPEPSRPAAQNTALDEQRKTIRKRAASRTLFSGGQGSLDTPTTASSVLLGV